jgi:hypothetical protein
MGTLGQNAITAMLASATMANSTYQEGRIFQIECGTQFAKAHAEVEGGQRTLYMRASNPSVDTQDERILADALMNSKDFFLNHGRIDLDHATVWGLIRDQKLDKENPYRREIGKPIKVIKEIERGEPSILVKAEIFQSKTPDNPVTRASDWFWNTLQISPPMTWYPSVAGTILPGGYSYENDNGKRVRTINNLRWHSIGLTRTPVNTSVAPIGTLPLGALAKALMMGSPLDDIAGLVPVGPDEALNSQGIKVPENTNLSLVPALLSHEEIVRISNSIEANAGKMSADEWFSTPEGIALLIALHDNSRIYGGV